MKCVVTPLARSYPEWTRAVSMVVHAGSLQYTAEFERVQHVGVQHACVQ